MVGHSDYYKRIYKCKRCGTPITDYRGHKICAPCVIDEIYDTYAAGGKITNSMRTRARYKGIDVKEIKKTVKEDARTVLH